jgi:protein-S-isoprenylcysteine O-methyltransferase Ste14
LRLDERRIAIYAACVTSAREAATDPRRFPFPPAIPVIALLLSWAIGRIWTVNVNWPAWSRAFGWVLMLAAVSLAFAAVLTFRRYHTAVDPRGTVSTMVTSGPFRYTRNPMYLSLLVLYIGGVLAFRLPWALVLLPPVFLALHVGVILPEERHLEAACGEPYRHYRQRVRRWF